MCVLLRGAARATDPAVHVVVHRLSRMAPDLPPAAALVAHDDGSFEAVLGGRPDGGYRIVAHGDGGTTVVDFSPDTAGGPGPWRIVPFTVPEAAACIEISPAILDFGAVRVDWVDTAVAEIRNGCDMTVDLLEAQVPHVPTGARGPAFDVVFRPATLAPGDSVGVVVVFWPQEGERYTGALLVDFGHPTLPEVQVLSAPVGGRTAPR
jgi:hypothetical protein